MKRIGPVGKATMPDESKATPVPILFLDSETTSLRVPWRKAPRTVWEFGAVLRAENGTEQDYAGFVADPDLTNADPISLSIGGFYERHPQYKGHVYVPYGAAQDRSDLYTEAEVAHLIEWLARGAHIVGAVPDFDTSTFDAMLANHGLAWPGHYHVVCAEVYAAGAIGWVPPYDSKALSLAIGVDPGKYAQHEALADAQWARDLFDAARTWTGGRVQQVLPWRGQRST